MHKNNSVLPFSMLRGKSNLYKLANIYQTGKRAQIAVLEKRKLKTVDNVISVFKLFKL
jgi:hypothetical protein